jgi:hypothetical protein
MERIKLSTILSVFMGTILGCITILIIKSTKAKDPIEELHPVIYIKAEDMQSFMDSRCDSIIIYKEK